MTKEQEIILKINEMNFLLIGEAKEKYSPVLQEVLSMLKEKDEKIEYYRRQKDYDMQFRHELLEEIKCLNLDKDEKDKEIDELKQTLARNIARNVTSSMKESVKSKEDLEMLNAGWQIELEKKEKQIDLMADFMYKAGTGRRVLSCMFRQNDECNENGCRYCIKQYFESKAINDG